MSDQIRSTCPRTQPLRVRLWFGAPSIVVGLGAIGYGLAALMQGTLFGLAGIGLGAICILIGVSVLMENKTLFGVAGIAIGVPIVGVAVGALADGGSLFAVATLSLVGVAMIGLGVADCVENKTLHALAGIGLGVAMSAVGGFLVSAGDRLAGIAGIAIGVAVIGAEITTLRHATGATPTSDEYKSEL